MKAFNFRFELLSPQTLEGALDCLTETFVNEEPITAHLGVSRDEFQCFARELLLHSLPSRLSWVVRHPTTAQVVAVRVCTDWDDDYEAGDHIGEKMRVVSRFLAYVSEPLQQRNLWKEAKIVHAHMVAVDSRHRGVGLAQRLLVLSSCHAQENGYQFVVGEVTSEINFGILSRIKSFRPLRQVRYDDYTVAGEKPFGALKGHRHCTLFVYKLGDFSLESLI